MKKRTYDEVIGRLRTLKPTIEDPQELTDHILDRLPENQAGKRIGITISDNCGRWNIFIGLRTISAVAAAFLIGFFAFQQWEIESKVSRLEDEIANQRNSSISLDQMDNLSAAHLKSLLQQQVKYSKSNLAKSSETKESFIMNRNSLNQLMQLLEQLEEENRILKSEIIKQLADTLKKRPNNKIRLL